MATLFTDAASGSDNNGGTSAGAAKATGTAAVTNGTTLVQLDAGSNLSTVVPGDYIRIASRTDGIRSTNIYNIVSVNDGLDQVTLTQSPGGASGQSWSIGGAWQTLSKAALVVQASTGDKVWVKASASYLETLTMSVNALQNTPIVFEGYTTSTGDGGKATIDGESTRTNGINDSLSAGTNRYYVFQNLIITNHDGIGCNTDGNHITWKNCEFTNNAGVGLNGKGSLVQGCVFSGASSTGCVIQSGGGPAVFVGCRAFNNVFDGISTWSSSASTVMFACEFFGNDDNAINCAASNDTSTAIINCTIDGNDQDTANGINISVAFRQYVCVVNTIVYDCFNGISSANDGVGIISVNNLVNANITPYGSFSTTSGEVTGAPDFADEANNDYRLNASSPANDAGYDRGLALGQSTGMDIGAFQRVVTAGASATKAKHILSGGAL